MDKTIVFRIVGSSIDITTRQPISLNDGTKGIVTSIKSVRPILGVGYEVIGRIKPL